MIVQRCYKYRLVAAVRQACDILGKKMIFETDDDYLHLPPYNPCAFEINPQTREEFKEILRMADQVTVSTEELKNVYYPYNKNIDVLPNNVKEVFYFKDVGTAEVDNMGNFDPIFQHGLIHVPAYGQLEDGSSRRLVRIGYTGTPTHRQDFETIRKEWFKTLKKFKDKVCVIYVGDEYFAKVHEEEMGKSNMIYIAPSQYWLYYMHIRNFDIGIAPLVPDVFNMGKSPIKAVEYASWGVPAILPNFITYEREFVNGTNCLMYYNDREFGTALGSYIEDREIRVTHGRNAREHVRLNRLEELPHNSARRAGILRNLYEGSTPITMFEPNKKEIKNETETVGTPSDSQTP